MAANDTILEIGALIDLSTLTPGLAEMTSQTVSATGLMGESFTTLAATTTGAAVRTVEAVGGIPIGLGAVQSSVSTTGTAVESSSAEMTAAMERLMVAVEALTTAMAQMPLRVVPAVKESEGALTLLQEKLVGTAETAKLTTAGIGAGFSGLAAVLGGGAILGLMGHFLDETTKEVLELGHLADKVGISIESLSGLQLSAREMGIQFESLTGGMVRLERAQALAVEGHKQQAEAFKMLGITMSQLKDMSPEEVFNTLSGAIQRMTSTADINRVSMALLGRGGAVLTPIFKQYGDTLTEVMKKQGENNGITEQSYEEALKFQKTMADLGAQFRSIATEALPKVNTALEYLRAGWWESIAALNVLMIKMEEWAQDMKALATSSPANAIQAISDNAKIADLNIAQLNKETTELVRNALGMKALGDDPFNLKSLMTQVEAKFPTVKNTPSSSMSGEEAKKEAAEQMAAIETQMASVQEYSSKYFELAQERYEVAVKYLTAESTAAQSAFRDIVEARRKLNEGSAAEAGKYSEMEAAAQDKALATEMASVQKNSAAYFNLLQERYNLAVQTYGAEDEHAEEAFRRILEARRKLTEDEAAEAQKIEDQQNAVRSVDLSAEAAHQRSLLDMSRSTIEQQYSLGLISNSQRIQALENALTEEYNAELRAVQDKMRLYEGDTVNYEKALKEKEALDDRYTRQMTQLEQQQLTQRLQSVKRFTDSMAQDFGQAIGSMITEQKSFGQAMAQLLDQILGQFLAMLAKMVAQWILDHTIMKVAAMILGDTNSTDDQIAQNVTLAQSDAAVAAANTLALASAVYLPPVPEVLATAAYAVGEAFAGAASAEQGALLGKDTLLQAHAGELIVPAQYVPSVLAATGPSFIGQRPEISGTAATALRSSIPFQEQSLPTGIRQQFDLLSHSISAEKGALLSTDTMVQAHSGELIVPAQYVPGALAAIGQVGQSHDIVSALGGEGGAGGPGGAGGAGGVGGSVLGTGGGVNASTTVAVLPGGAFDTRSLPATIRDQFNQVTSSVARAGSDSNLAMQALGGGLSSLLATLPSRNRTLPDMVKSRFEQVSGTLGAAGSGSQQVLTVLGESLGTMVNNLPPVDRPMLTAIKNQFEQVSGTISSGRTGSNLALAIAARVLGVGAGTSGATGTGNFSIPSAEDGALLGRDTLLQAHKDELVLPAPISAGLMGMLTKGFGSFTGGSRLPLFQTPPAAVQDFAAGNVYNNINNFSAPAQLPPAKTGVSTVSVGVHTNIQAMDMAGAAPFVKNLSRNIAKQMEKELLSGHLDPTKLLDRG